MESNSPRRVKYAIVKDNPVPYLFPDSFGFASVIKVREKVVSVGTVTFRTDCKKNGDTEFIVECTPFEENRFKCRPEEDARLIKKWMLTPDGKNKARARGKEHDDE